jgi:hypothetical protein
MSQRYPGSNILGQRGHWDAATRKVILDRVQNVPPFRHFDEHACQTLEVLCNRVLPQDDRPPERRIPIAPWIDARCYHKIISGFRLENMPPDHVAWDEGLAGLDETAQELFAADFADLDPARQDEVLRAVSAGAPPGGIWQHLPAKRWWIFIAVRQICGIYYAHPTAWDEIGFGGPAYPRGYFALNNGAPEPWEAKER